METDIRQVAAFREEVARTERLSPEQLARYCQNRLGEMCDFARRNAPYYRKRLAPLFAKGEFDFSRWRDVPVLSRDLARTRYHELRAIRVPPNSGDTEEEHTSGSTGLPLRFLVIGAQAAAAQVFSNRAYDWWGMDGTKNFGSIHVFIGKDHQMLAEQGAQGWRYDAMVGMNYGCPLHWSTDFMLDWLARKNIRYLSTRPAMVEMLAEAVVKKGIKLKLDALLTVGGPVTQEMRDLALEVFGLPIRDTYGSTECGNMAVDCPQCGLLHINEEGALIEVVRDDGEPCGPDEMGRLLITPFFNYAMPLVRYDTGDFAALAAGPNPCGRPHRSLRRVLGRETEAFIRRDGSRFFPRASAKLCYKYIAFEQMQFVQTEYETVELRYIKTPGDDRLDLPALEHHLHQEFGPEFAIKLVPVAEIPRGPRAKFLYHLCEVTRPIPKLLAGNR